MARDRRRRPAWMTESGGPSAWRDMGAARWWVLLGAGAAAAVSGQWVLPLVALAGLLAAAWLIDAASRR